MKNALILAALCAASAAACAQSSIEAETSTLSMSASAAAPAESAAADRVGQWSLAVHGLTQHLQARKPNYLGQGWEQVNTGLGLRRQMTADVALQGGFYRNSIYRESVYLMADWTPLRSGLVSAGAFAGVVNGYTAPQGYYLTPTRSPASFMPAGGLTARVAMPCLPHGGALVARMVPSVAGQTGFVTFELAVGF